MTKLYHVTRNGWVWVVAVANGRTHWLYIKGPAGHLIR